MHTVKIPEQKTGNFSLHSQRVTWEMNTTDLEQILGEHFSRFSELLELVHTNPRHALRAIRPLREKFPTLPEMNLLLAYSLIVCRKVKKGAAVLKENYEQNPDHLLTKINYADHCLRKGDLDTVRTIFDNKIDLKEVYPKKRVFHISEFRGFMTLMGHYHLLIGKRDEAICYHYLAAKVDPRHPSTAVLGRKLYKQSKFLKLFRQKRK
jgi:hypothetical protein